jgi:signal transduction histidine kinase
MPTELHFPTDIDVTEFLSKEAHDLKSPFNRILGFTKLILRGMDGPISEQAKEDLSTAYHNSLQALLFMSSLIEMARLSRGEKKPRLVESQVDLLIKQVIVDWKRTYPKEKLPEIKSSAPSISIPVDEALFRQCLSYWISYVLEFTPEEPQVEIQVEDQPDACRFTVRSQGKKLLPPPLCDLTLYGYIAHRILELHQGVLVSALEDDNGAVVQFQLPKGDR